MGRRRSIHQGNPGENVDENLKNKTAEIFESLGIDIPTAIRIFFKRAVAEKGIPFELREPTAIYSANPGWKAFEDLHRQALRSGSRRHERSRN